MNAFKVCYVSAEVAPFATTSRMKGLAQTSKALPVMLKEMEQDIRLMMPKYKSINERRYVLREVIRLQEVAVEMGGVTRSANGKTAFLPNSKVHVYFLNIPEFFDRKGFYEDPKTGKDYEDNGERFANFCKGVLETLKILCWQPDIIHCADWATGLLPYYLKTHYGEDEFFQNTRTVLTIHNFNDQGIFSPDMLNKIDIPESMVAAGQPLELDGKLNMLKAGLVYADIINTTSQFSADAILGDAALAHGLADTLETRGNDLHAILNGTDYDEWDPENDQHLSAVYSTESLSEKYANKVEICNEFGLSPDPDTPLLAIMPEPNNEPTLGPVIETLEEMLKSQLQVLVMEARPSAHSGAFARLAEEYPEQVIFYERYDTRLSHLLTAGADIILMTADSEIGRPHHLNGLRYGTIPVVHHSGGLADAVRDHSEEDGNGFVFEKADKKSISAALKAAVKLYKDKAAWARLQAVGMEENYSWETTASQYFQLYDMASMK